MGYEAEASVRSRSIPKSVPVVGGIVAEEVGDGRVEVAAIKNHQHVIDQVRNIEKVLVTWVDRAVDVQSLDLEIIGVVGEAVRGRLPETVPGVRISVCLLYTSDAADERSSVDLGG